MTSIADLDRITTDSQYWAVNRAMLAINEATRRMSTKTDSERASFKEKRAEYNRLRRLISDHNAAKSRAGYPRVNYKDGFLR